MDGIVKSSVGLGVLLFHGIGDTIRISLLDEPEQEVLVAQHLLSSLNLRKFGPELICCPTCGRCAVDLPQRARDFEAKLQRLSLKERQRLKDAKIALMGCIVNGPGEAREATAGIAFSKHKGLLFEHGRALGAVGFNESQAALLKLLGSGRRRAGRS